MQATQTQTQTEVTTAPVAPAAPPAPVTIRIVGADGTAQTLAVPATSQQYRELVRQREELGSQLSSVSDRRRQLSEEIRTAPDGASKAGLEGRLAILDQRIMTLENDLAVTGQQLAAASSELVSSSEVTVGGNGHFEEGMVFGGVATLLTFPILYFFLRRRWRKKAGQNPAPDMTSESARRLERLEQGMESIAIEIERVSEGQRFVTRLLSEGHSPVTASRIAEPVSANAPRDP